MNWNNTSYVWPKIDIQASCYRCALTEHQLYFDCKSADINECFIEQVLKRKQRSSKIEPTQSLPIVATFVSQWFCRPFCFSSGVLWIFNSTWDWKWIWYGWRVTGLGDDVMKSQRVVDREHNWVRYPKKDSLFLHSMIRLLLSCHQLKCLSLRFWLFCTLTRDDWFWLSGQELQMLGSQSFRSVRNKLFDY